MNYGNNDEEGTGKMQNGRTKLLGWVSNVLAAGCKKGVAPSRMGRYDAAMVLLVTCRKKDVGRRREEEHQKLVNQMISGAEDALVLAQNHETSSMERLSAGAGKFGGRCQAHERCEDKGKSGRSIGSVQVSTLP